MRRVRLLIAVAFAFTLGVPLAGAPAPNAGAQAASCDDFQFFEFAQSVFEEDPAGWAALDPDGDGVACPDLPSGVAPALWTGSVPASAVPVTFRRVVDGDTIEVNTSAGVDTLRLILIDTPETKSPNDPIECFGPEATAYAEWLLGQDADLYIESDVTNRDRYDRLLRYLWLDFGDGFVVQLNEAIVRSGHGILSTYPPDVAYVDQIRAAQEFANRHGLGLWSACGGADNPIGIAAPTPAPQAAPQPAPASSSCNASYPDACIPSGPDLDCGDIPQRRFTVLPPDPHNFDGDRDGIGCESD